MEEAVATPAISTITGDQPVVTLINVFTVAPEQQDALVALLDRATDEVMRHLPGFVSANIHRGLDGDKVANYAQWETRAAFEAMLGDPAAGKHMAQALQIASVEPVLFEVASVHHR